jgi:hypothetical protein
MAENGIRRKSSALRLAETVAKDGSLWENSFGGCSRL